MSANSVNVPATWKPVHDIDRSPRVQKQSPYSYTRNVARRESSGNFQPEGPFGVECFNEREWMPCNGAING